MSTVSPIPFEPFESFDALFNDAPPVAARPGLKKEAAERIASHRRKRGDSAPSQPVDLSPKNPIAAAVAARYQQTVSYQEFLTVEAETKRQQAEASAEIARRNAEAIAQAQKELMEEMAEWNARIAAANASNPHLETSDVVMQPVLVEPAAASSVEMAPEITEAATVEEAYASVVVAARKAFNLPVDVPTTTIPANLIEFPRQLVATRKARARIAEGPLRDEADASPERAQLRIFEVEADQISTEQVVESSLPEWSSIRLESTQPFAPASLEAQTSLTIPPQTAPVSQRAMAAVVDASCVGGAFLAFVGGVSWAAPVMPSGILAGVSAAAVLFALYLGYHLMFFTLSDSTPGMRYARIGLCTFGDENPTRKAMRHRIFAKMLAACPMGMGLLWACMDDDKLGWHDRISRMYQRAY